MNFVDTCCPVVSLLLILLLVVTQRVDCDDEDHVCEDLKRPDSEGKFEVLCVGMLHKKMLMVTTSWMVYELPMESLSSTINKLYLNGTKPVALTEKWPTLAKSKQYQDSYKQMYNCFSAVDNVSDYLIGTEHNEDFLDPIGGWGYDMSKDLVFKGYPYHGKDTQVLISSNQLKSFYAINHGLNNNDKGIRIMRYHFTSDIVLNSSAISPDVLNTFYRLCQVGKSEMKMVKNDSDQCDPLVWPVLKGFIADGNFYLFGGNYIFTFPASVYEKDNVPVKFENVSMNDFIQCSGNVTDARAGAVSGVGWALIIGLILLILIAVLLCLLCLMRQANKEKHKTKKRRDSKKDGGSSSASRSPRSARSTGVNGYGKLAAAGDGAGAGAGGSRNTARSSKRPSSKRLSKKNSAKSARSTNPGKYGQLTAKCTTDKSIDPRTARSRGSSASKGGKLSKRNAASKSRSRGGVSGASGRSGLTNSQAKRLARRRENSHSRSRNSRQVSGGATARTALGQ